MARLPRLTLPGHLHHVILRGNNRQPIFHGAEDFEALLTLLKEGAANETVAVHAYVLMDNHFHLLVTPTTQDGLPRMMQAVGRRYVQYFNRRHARTGTLWEGRYRSTVLQPERYLLACMVYLDLNPMRAGLMQQPADYVWSSHAHWLGLRNDRWLTPHALYWALGNTPFAREAAYAQLLDRGASEEVQEVVLQAALKGWVLGGESFVQGLQQQTERRLTRQKAGRPVRGDAPIG